MPKTYKIEIDERVGNERKNTQNKQVDKRLRAVQLRSAGKSNQEIAEQLETSSDMVSRWVSNYAKGGIQALLPKPRSGRPTTLSFSEEATILAKFKERAEQGQIIEVGEIKNCYEKAIGHTIGGSQIYYVLKRHGWRKVMPRSKHPNKADDEAIEASKKLTFEWLP
ncbi:MAG: helix-turn-helix domain-containing protein [Bradymonadales bacterium]